MTSQQAAIATLFWLLLLTCDQISAGKLFEWVDQHGAKHFSDRAPVGLPFAEKVLRPASGDGRRGKEIGLRRAERDLLKNAGRHQSEIEHARQIAAQQIEQRKSNCRQARTRYHEAIHEPGRLAGRSDFRTYRRKMKAACD